MPIKACRTASIAARFAPRSLSPANRCGRRSMLGVGPWCAASQGILRKCIFRHHTDGAGDAKSLTTSAGDRRASLRIAMARLTETEDGETPRQ